MDQNTARGLINEILYGIDRVPDLRDKTMAMRCATSIVNRRHFLDTVDRYAEAIAHALRANHLPTQTVEMSRRYGEAELLGFLANLAACLDELRPWPKPAYIKLDVAEWNTFGRSTAVAKIVRPMHQINGILNNSFDQVPLETGNLPVMVLELRSGEVVALVGSVDSRSTTFLLMPRDPGDPAALIARFCEYTGFAPQEILPLTE